MVYLWNPQAIVPGLSLHVWRDRERRPQFTPRKGIRIPQCAKCLPVKSEILSFGIRNTAQGIRNPRNDLNRRIQVPRTTTGIQCVESEIHGVESEIHGVESRIQDSLGFPHEVTQGYVSKSFKSVIIQLKL